MYLDPKPEVMVGRRRCGEGCKGCCWRLEKSQSKYQRQRKKGRASDGQRKRQSNRLANLIMRAVLFYCGARGLGSLGLGLGLDLLIQAVGDNSARSRWARSMSARWICRRPGCGSQVDNEGKSWGKLLIS